MKIELRGSETVGFPMMCPCCGEAADTKHPVRGFSYSKGKMTMHTWDVPMCQVCVAHGSRFGAAGGLPPQLKAWELPLVVLTLGLYMVFWRLVVLPKREAERAVKAEVERAAARAACKPGCGDVAGLKFDRKGESNVFDIPSKTYARAFVSANQASLTAPSDEVKALLSA